MILRYQGDIQIQMFIRQEHTFVWNSGKRLELEKTMGIVEIVPGGVASDYHRGPRTTP